MTQNRHYDAVIIGDGQSGGPLSTALAGSGRRTAVIEREHAGGTCINTGCTPTKTMVASARVAYLARRARDFGVIAGEVAVDMTIVRQRKRDIVESFRAGSLSAVENGGVDFLMGEARFTGPHTIETRLQSGETLDLDADTIFINTGTRPVIPPLDGLDTVPYLTSTTIMELDEVPDHLLVLGGGYIALEFGQMFRRFGSEVTLVELSPRFLSREDADIADTMADILREDGIQLHVGTSALRVERGDNGEIHLVVKNPEGELTLQGSHLLVAVGRMPNTEALDMDAAGIACNERGFVRVNDRLETNVPDVYAMGEVAGTPAFTHMSYDDFRILRTNLLEGGARTTKDRLVPYTVFTDPQLGRVGLTEQEARKQGRAVQVGTMPMSSVARALEVAESRGLVKAVVDRDTKQILGCSVLGLEGGEIMAMVEIAMLGKLPYTALRDGIFAHPTLAELFNNLFGNLKD